MIRSLLRPSLLLACVLASGCGPAPVEPEPTPEATLAQPLRWPRWIRIVAADIVGGGEGATAGGAIGSIFGPAGTTIGAITGAVICGASASGEAADKLNSTKGVPAGTKASVDPTNAINPFDHVGQNHNASLNAIVSVVGLSGCIPNPLPRDLIKSRTWEYASKQMNAPQELLALPEFEAAWKDSLDFAAAAAEDDIEVVIQNRVKSGKMTAAVGQWFIRYFTAVSPLDTDKLIEATKSFEKEAMADKTLKEAERTTLLSAFSIARHSAAYWADQAARSDSPWRSCQ